MASIRLIVLHSALLRSCYGFVDFGDLTHIKPPPTVSIPRPHQLPPDWQMRYNEPSHPSITAAIPYIVCDNKGTPEISWSTEYYPYSRHFQNARGILHRRGGVFQNDASLLATCTQCGGNQTLSDACSAVITYSGLLASIDTSTSDTFCYGSDYTGALFPTSTSTSLPCCASCTPIQNGTATITGGVLATDTSATAGVPANTTKTSTVTVIENTSTLPQVTLSVSTISANSSGVSGMPTVTTVSATAIGCGTASGSGTVVGTGTVYVGPGGLIPVVSTGTVSGFANKVIGCGTMIATSGSFSGSATITGCGTGSGCATLTGSGVVYPNILGGLIGITSSGTAYGCGKVVGCGILTGTGTFTITEPYTTTIIANVAAARPTVEVYISYCPPEGALIAPFRMGNSTSPSSHSNSSTNHKAPSTSSLFSGNQGHRYTNGTFSPLRASNSTNSTDSTNPLCQLCPNDTGICCPLTVACGADGHCPYTALQGAGYILHGVNIVDCLNSSSEMGMVSDPARVAPALREGSGVVRRRHTHGHGYRRGFGREHGVEMLVGRFARW